MADGQVSAGALAQKAVGFGASFWVRLSLTQWGMGFTPVDSGYGVVYTIPTGLLVDEERTRWSR